MSGKEYSAIVKSAGIIMICTLAFKILGFIRDLLLTYYFGTSGISDAFLISQTIPSTLFEFVGTGLTACFIPVFFQILANAGVSRANEFTNKITTLILTFATILIVAVWFKTDFFINIFASGFKAETFNIACKFTRIGILSLYFSSFVFVFSSYLQANKRFFPSAITAVIQNLIILFAIYVGAKFNLLLMSSICALAIGVRLLYLWPSVIRLGYQVRLDFRWKNKNVYKFGILLLPVVLGSTVNDVNVIIDRTLASQIAVGAISALSYGNSIIQFANGGIIQPIATVYFPYITKSINTGKTYEATEMLKKTLGMTLMFFIPLTIIFIVYNTTIIQLLFERGAFKSHALSLTSTAFYYYSIGLCFIATREILSRFYYAYGDTKTPTINAIIGVILNIIFNLLLSKILGIGGLALATSLSAAITTILLILRSTSKLKVPISDIFDKTEIAKLFLIGSVVYLINKCHFIVFGEKSFLVNLCIIFLSLIIYIYLGKKYRIPSILVSYNWIKYRSISILHKNQY